MQIRAFIVDTSSWLPNTNKVLESNQTDMFNSLFIFTIYHISYLSRVYMFITYLFISEVWSRSVPTYHTSEEQMLAYVLAQTVSGGYVAIFLGKISSNHLHCCAISLMSRHRPTEGRVIHLPGHQICWSFPPAQKGCWPSGGKVLGGDWWGQGKTEAG